MLLAVPKTKTKLYGDRSFADRAPRLNALPVGIKNSESLNIFKSKLKLEDSCACAIEYRDHIIVEYRDYYYHHYYYV